MHKVLGPDTWKQSGVTLQNEQLMSQDVLFPIKRPVCISHADLVESNLYGAFNNKLIVA